MERDELEEALSYFDRVQDLAKMIGRSTRQVRNYRSGRCKISSEVARRIRTAVTARKERTGAARGGKSVRL